MDYKSAKYFIGFHFSKSSLFDADNMVCYDKLVNSIIVNFPLKLKQEGLSYKDNLNITKIRKIKISTHPIISLVEKSMPCKSISIYITGDEYTKFIPPKLIINIHSSVENFFPRINEKSFNFFIVGIRNDITYNKDSILSIIKMSYKDLNGVIGGFKGESSYAINGNTYIEWAYRNFPIHIQNQGLTNWGSDFDEIWH